MVSLIETYYRQWSFTDSGYLQHMVGAGAVVIVCSERGGVQIE